MESELESQKDFVQIFIADMNQNVVLAFHNSPNVRTLRALIVQDRRLVMQLNMYGGTGILDDITQNQLNTLHRMLTSTYMTESTLTSTTMAIITTRLLTDLNTQSTISELTVIASTISPTITSTTSMVLSTKSTTSIMFLAKSSSKATVILLHLLLSIFVFV